jgi:hypothetical protein
MKNKARKTPRKSTLHISELVEITDPVEQAALDRRFRAAEKALAARENSRRPKTRNRK